MKKILCILMMLAMIVPAVALADTTSPRVPGSGGIAKHVHEYTDSNTWRPDRNSLIYGPGIDIVLWESPFTICESIEAQTRYDFGNHETTVYAVVKVNLWRFLNKNK